MSLTVAEIARICKGTAEGDTARTISAANTLEEAGEGDLAFVGSGKAIRLAENSQAGCLLVALNFDVQGPWSVIRVPDPRSAFVTALHELYPAKRRERFVHATAEIAPTAHLAGDCFIGAYTVVGDSAEIAEGCQIANNCAIGDGVRLGAGSVLHPNVTVYNGVRIGARAILHAGCVIGADGFGFILTGDRYEKFPQVGTVEIGDDVEIGANCCIDRAALGATRIGNGTKLDNLVHVAHNCVIGKHVVIAAQTGLSGSVTVGDYAVIGGQTGIGEKARIDARAVIGGKAGILTGQRISAGEPVWGIPARPLRQHLKGLANVGRLPELKEEVVELRRKLAGFEAQQQSKS